MRGGFSVGKMMSNDLAGVWEVALSDGVHRIEFEHGTTTGKRVIYVDGKVTFAQERRPLLCAACRPTVFSELASHCRRS